MATSWKERINARFQQRTPRCPSSSMWTSEFLRAGSTCLPVPSMGGPEEEDSHDGMPASPGLTRKGSRSPGAASCARAGLKSGSARLGDGILPCVSRDPPNPVNLLVLCCPGALLSTLPWYDSGTKQCRVALQILLPPEIVGGGSVISTAGSRVSTPCGYRIIDRLLFVKCR
jgi:hypothetical protein